MLSGDIERAAWGLHPRLTVYSASLSKMAKMVLAKQGTHKRTMSQQSDFC